MAGERVCVCMYGAATEGREYSLSLAFVWGEWWSVPQSRDITLAGIAVHSTPHSGIVFKEIHICMSRIIQSHCLSFYCNIYLYNRIIKDKKYAF